MNENLFLDQLFFRTKAQQICLHQKFLTTISGPKLLSLSGLKFLFTALRPTVTVSCKYQSIFYTLLAKTNYQRIFYKKQIECENLTHVRLNCSQRQYFSKSIYQSHHQKHVDKAQMMLKRNFLTKTSNWY